MVFCNNIHHLFLDVDLLKYKPEERKFFIDSLKRSLKCVLLHNGNQFGSIPIPIGPSVTLKEKYENMKLVLDKILWASLANWYGFQNGELSVMTAEMDVQSIHVFCAIGIPELNPYIGSKMCGLQVKA